MNRILSLTLIGLLAVSCSKQNIREFEGNQAAEDNAITSLEKESYINRLYISLLGRKASDAEFQDALALLGTADQKGREMVIDALVGRAEYKLHFQDRFRIDLVEAVDSLQVRRDYLTYQQLLQDTGLNPNFREALMVLLPQLEALLNINVDLLSGKSDYETVIRLLVENPYYDQINMGTENFVVSMFQHFLDRYPSNQELDKAKIMVNGQSSSLFLQTGSSKGDFLDIFFTSDAFAEGWIHRLYQRHLFRKATQDEVLSLTNVYRTNGYEAMHTTLLSTQEYFEQ